MLFKTLPISTGGYSTYPPPHPHPTRAPVFVNGWNRWWHLPKSKLSLQLLSWAHCKRDKFLWFLSWQSILYFKCFYFIHYLKIYFLFSRFWFYENIIFSISTVLFTCRKSKVDSVSDILHNRIPIQTGIIANSNLTLRTLSKSRTEQGKHLKVR